MRHRREQRHSSEILLLVLAAAFCVIVGTILITVFRAVGVQLF